ncbi:MAG: phosphatase PAP2 family protein [Synechocystis sp.]|nr:phosphatase PAP2 family protein [Synechocystis sp.]
MVTTSAFLSMKSLANSPYLRWLKIVGVIPFLLCLAIAVLLITVGPQFSDAREIPFDIAFLDFLHQIIPDASAPFWKFVYQVTGAELTAGMVVISLGIFIWKRYWSEAKYLAFATLGILLVVDQGLKPIFNRRRPLESLVEVDGRSFPSGHAAGGVVFYYYLAYVMSTHYPQYRWQIYGGTTLWVGFIGLSSMYCRVHWLSDIIAGYSVGFVWLTLTLFLLRRSEPNTYLKHRQ